MSDVLTVEVGPDVCKRCRTRLCYTNVENEMGHGG